MLHNDEFSRHENMSVDRNYLIYTLQKVEKIYNHTRNVVNKGGRLATKFAIKKMDELDDAVKTARTTCYYTPIGQLTEDNIINFFVTLQYISCECFSILSPRLKKKKVDA